MSVQATPAMYSCSILSDFQQWAGVIDSAIVALGWVVTTDTGQTAPASFTSFTAGTASYYRVYKMADALQATLPVFLRIDYKCNATAGPSLKFQVATGTDGAGNLTGNIGTAFTHAGAAAVVNTTLYQCYFSGSTNRLSMSLWPVAGSARAMGFTIERSHDTSGADTSEYFSWNAVFGGSSYNQQTIMLPASGGVSPLETGGSVFKIPAIRIFINSIFFSPIFPCLGAYGNPTFSGFMSGLDVTHTGSITISLYGAAHNLMTFNGQPYAYVDGSGSSAWLMRYE